MIKQKEQKSAFTKVTEDRENIWNLANFLTFFREKNLYKYTKPTYYSYKTSKKGGGGH